MLTLKALDLLNSQSFCRKSSYQVPEIIFSTSSEFVMNGLEFRKERKVVEILSFFLRLSH